MGLRNQLTTSDHLPYDEFVRFLNCLHKDKEYRWEMYARLSFCTACRASDVLNMKWKDVLNTSSMVVTEQKTGKTRRIPFNPSVQKKFHDLWTALERPDKEDYIMSSPSGKKAMTIQHINRMLKNFKYKYALKIEHFSTHTFRKTFGRYVYETNNRSAESLLLLNKILNHHSVQTTKIYIGITQEEVNGIFSSISF